MIVDSSAIIAILRNEPDAAAMAEALQEAPIRRISAVTYVEAAVVADNDRNPLLSRRFDGLVRDAQMLVEPVTSRQAEIAREAYRDFGKGRHKAGSTSGIASLTRWQRRWASRCCSKGTTFATPTSSRLRTDG